MNDEDSGRDSPDLSALKSLYELSTKFHAENGDTIFSEQAIASNAGPAIDSTAIHGLLKPYFKPEGDLVMRLVPTSSRGETCQAAPYYIILKERLEEVREIVSL